MLRRAGDGLSEDLGERVCRVALDLGDLGDRQAARVLPIEPRGDEESPASTSAFDAMWRSSSVEPSPEP